MYASIGYPPVKEYKWFKQSNQVKYCPVTVKDIDVAHKIWVKSVPGLIGNITRKKAIPVAVNLLQVPEELVKIHKDI